MSLWFRQEVQTMPLSELTEQFVASKLPKRPNNANKGTFGRVLVVAGSENYSGAAYLACAGAYRVGAGLVTLVTDKTTKIIVSRKLPEVTFLKDKEIVEKAGEYNVLLIGPGLDNRQFEYYRAPMTVIDGDGLRWHEKFKGNVVLTPHPGEMSRLTGLTIKEIQKNREEVALKFAKIWNKIVVLKGANTVIAPPKSGVKISPFANPALATAGTGDILAGIISGLLAQGLNLFDASCVGVYLHGLAGEIARKKIGDAGVLASDLLPILPETIRHIQTSNQ